MKFLSQLGTEQKHHQELIREKKDIQYSLIIVVPNMPVHQF